jgi:hypothetical protein
MKRFLILPLIFLSFGNNCYADNTPVEKMFKVMKIDEQLNGGFEAMLPVIDQMAAKFKLDSTGKEELLNIYRVWFNEDIDRTNIVNQMKELYTDSFTKEEIIEVTKFYQTEIGQKFLNKSPELMKLGAQIGMTEAQSKQAQLLSRLKPFFEKHNIK